MKNFVAKIHDRINGMSKVQEFIWVCLLSCVWYIAAYGNNDVRMAFDR